MTCVRAKPLAPGCFPGLVVDLEVVGFFLLLPPFSSLSCLSSSAPFAEDLDSGLSSDFSFGSESLFGSPLFELNLFST